jgi:hypothetical protein
VRELPRHLITERDLSMPGKTKLEK